jgi:hypothetical protein
MLRPHVEDNFVRAQHGGGDFGCLVVRHFDFARSSQLAYCPLSIPRFSRTQSVSCFKMS